MAVAVRRISEARAWDQTCPTETVRPPETERYCAWPWEENEDRLCGRWRPAPARRQACPPARWCRARRTEIESVRDVNIDESWPENYLVGGKQRLCVLRQRAAVQIADRQ